MGKTKDLKVTARTMQQQKNIGFLVGAWPPRVNLNFEREVGREGEQADKSFFALWLCST